VSAVAARSHTHKVGWAAMLGVLVLALFLGVTTNRPPTTEAGRFQNLTKSIACPVCEGQSVADSDSDAAKGIRARIAQRLDEGATDAQIRNELADAYGQHILLTPARSGLSSVVWTLPVAALVVAVAGLAMAFRRWRGGGAAQATDEDRALVAQARSAGNGGSPP